MLLMVSMLEEMLGPVLDERRPAGAIVFNASAVVSGMSAVGPSFANSSAGGSPTCPARR
jgi:hypothetical protein